MGGFMIERSWWSGPGAVEARRALIEAFRVEDLESGRAVRGDDEDTRVSGPLPEWEQAWALADEFHAIAAGLSPDPFDDAGWELRRRLEEQTVTAKSLGHRLASQAADRVIDYLRAVDRPGELYQRLSDQAEAATAAARARNLRSADRSLGRQEGRGGIGR